MREGNRARPRLTQHSYLQLRALSRHLSEEAANAGAGAVLDIGCGAKPYRHLFRGRYVGMDLSATHANPDCFAAAEHLPVATAAFDVVVSTQQLEHVEDPAAVLVEARRVLRRGGVLLLSTHGVWPYHPDPCDYWRWTEPGLARLVSSAGFAVERVRHQGELMATAVLLVIYPLGGLQRAPAPIRTLGGLLVAAANVVGLVLDGLTRRLLPRHYASPSYLVVARAVVRDAAPAP